MHDCEEFRERIAGYIIDRDDMALKEFQHELLMCSSCSEFYAQSREMMEALPEVDLSISEIEWLRIESRLRLRIHEEKPVAAAVYDRRKTGAPRSASATARSLKTRSASAIARSLSKKVPIQWRHMLAAAAMLLVTIALARWWSQPDSGVSNGAGPESAKAVYVEQSVPLDPVTVDFLSESELLLRTVMKIGPSDTDDLAEARKVASGQLAELNQRKQAVADVPPVASVMETYEAVLRDLRNVGEQSADEDISDIQKRIQYNGLIASMKAFQPRVTEISFGLK